MPCQAAAVAGTAARKHRAARPPEHAPRQTALFPRPPSLPPQACSWVQGRIWGAAGKCPVPPPRAVLASRRGDVTHRTPPVVPQRTQSWTPSLAGRPFEGGAPPDRQQVPPGGLKGVFAGLPGLPQALGRKVLGGRASGAVNYTAAPAAHLLRMAGWLPPRNPGDAGLLGCPRPPEPSSRKFPQNTSCVRAGICCLSGEQSISSRWEMFLLRVRRSL